MNNSVKMQTKQEGTDMTICCIQIGEVYEENLKIKQSQVANYKKASDQKRTKYYFTKRRHINLLCK